MCQQQAGLPPVPLHAGVPPCAGASFLSGAWCSGMRYPHRNAVARQSACFGCVGLACGVLGWRSRRACWRAAKEPGNMRLISGALRIGHDRITEIACSAVASGAAQAKGPA